MTITRNALKDSKITVMGLGLHGGGIATARFLAEAGARVTVTDLGSPEKLASSIEQLSGLDIQYVLGEHREKDFTEADLVIKNPAVPSGSPFLKMAKQIETDISLFLQLTDNPLIAVTGSKGKSTTVSAIHHVMKMADPRTRLGGNITVSPLSFINELGKDDLVILELSSWQLHDLGERDLLKPDIALITNIMYDHQNRYSTFRDYVNDKKLIYRNQKPGQVSIFGEDSWAEEFCSESRGDVYRFFQNKPSEPITGRCGWLEENRGFFTESGSEIIEIVPETLSVPGEHFRLNMLIAGMVLYKAGLKPELIREGLSGFKGVPHRMEHFATKEGIDFYNDSAATIPEAVAAAVESFKNPPVLITGGTDKELKFEVLGDALKGAKGIFLLEGSGTDKIMPVLRRNGISWNGPYKSLKEALEEAYKIASRGDAIILSPGCTSFGMFLNEFDRGDRFRELVGDL
ncbi:UDP-N-acetylmuramoyl-L-alanine--D-glutamate ligase [Spirochaeta isovalerica]|uniref:UDP-N-acetylmuramoylalanine--D-glutamate ligase n=1 Tax=Spirochaeta isovalerica TaxID=150 RepID=A0A841RJT5_9SPIO|nr:UDP-N-acetylmuramoyl-L-alanine--D-glutamate ligase [Spirochaeta isovalerica]MBB6482552.1 UDP-N-acetylmuramoylalanine--D-glutamate ligase [Spirochaeta isovalerica]